ncbi:hypothetical protein FKM82_024434 [Ascaphus truei]
MRCKVPGAAWCIMGQHPFLNKGHDEWRDLSFVLRKDKVTFKILPKNTALRWCQWLAANASCPSRSIPSIMVPEAAADVWIVKLPALVCQSRGPGPARPARSRLCR